MSSAKIQFIRSTLIALAAGALILIAIIASTLYLVYQTQNYVAGATEARRVRSSAADLLLTVQQAESGQRGYIITHDQSFLDSYSAAILDVGKRFDTFEKYAKDNSFLKIDTKAVRTLIDAKMAELKRTVALTEANRQEDALAAVRDETGLRLMNEIRANLRGIIATSDVRTRDQVTTQLNMASILRVVAVSGAIAILSLLVGVVFIITSYVREILAAQATMASLNTGLEERVRERTEGLMQANQEIQRYAYIVTHDLRAPLVNIMGFTAELESALAAIRNYFHAGDAAASDDIRQQASVAVEEDLPEAINFIRSSTRKMDGLINAILKISRDGRRPLVPEQVDLAQIIRTTGETLQHQVQDADGSLEVSVKVSGFVSDRFSIEQIIGNLFDNAIKYKDATRPLQLSVKAFAVNRFKVGIDFSDNGRGIAAEDHDRVFELFRRSGIQDSAGEGIGLAHVKSLVRNMGGDIKVKSELGKGTTFMIRLPADLSQFVRSHAV